MSSNSYQILKELDEKLNLDWNEIFQRYVKETLIKKGNTHYINCPFHGENTASFGISFGKRIMTCFGCGKHYSNILQFLKDHLMLSTQGLIEMLLNDGYITDLNILGENLNNFLEFDVKKNIYQKIENKFSDNEPLFQRILFYKGGLGKITDEKISSIQEMIQKKYKKDSNQLQISNSLLKEIQKNNGNYGLISNEYNYLSYYSGEKGSKSLKRFEEENKINYVYNDSISKKIQEIKQEQSLVNMLLQNGDKNLLSNWKETKIKSIFESKTFKRYIENQGFDYKKYGDLLITLFFNKETNFQYYIGEGFFDVYSMGLFGLPFYTGGTGIHKKQIYSFIKTAQKRSKTSGFSADINLFFDNDKGGLLGTVKFVNQWLKYLDKETIQNNDLSIRIFDFEVFGIGIKKIFSIFSFLSRKNEDSINEYFDELLRINNNGEFDALLKYDLIQNGLFQVFEEVQTDHGIIGKLKKRNGWNYDEASKHNLIVKDLGELPMIIQNLMFFLDKIEQKTKNKKGFELFKNCILGEFKNLFLKSYKDINEFKDIINKKISSNFITRFELNNVLLNEDYLFGSGKQQNVKFEISLKNELKNFSENIDIELESLNLLNFLCYQDELKEQSITSKNELRSTRSFIKSGIEEFGSELLSNFIQNLKSVRQVKEKIGEDEAERQYNKILLKGNLLINIWNELNVGELDELKRKVLLGYGLEEQHIKEILLGKEEFMNTFEIKCLSHIFNHYDQIYDILKNKIISEIKIHGSQENLIEISLFKNSFINLVDIIQQKRKETELLKDVQN